MICHLCKEDKLSKEFPFEPLTETCDHPLLHCLDCATASVKKTHKCSQCESVVSEDNEKYQEYLETLDFLFPNLEDDDDAVADSSCSVVGAGVSSGHVVVTTLSGESATLQYYPSKRIADLKREIETALKTPSNKQRLLYHDTELKTTNESHQLTTLKDFNVPPNSKLHLIILLYEVPDELDHVIFDFSWGYPYGRRDYLDVSAFLYNGRNCCTVIDYRNRESRFYPGVIHSGPADMDDCLEIGHHKVNVFLKSIPSSIDNVVFTLSAWRSSSISEYPNPSLKFYDANFPGKQLCDDEMRHARYCRAIVMCSLSKRDGRWAAVRLKVGSDGFTRDYWPLKETIEDLIRRGYT